MENELENELNQPELELTAFVRSISTSNNEAVFEVVLVSHEFDRYNTKINHSGFLGTPSTTSVYYNHGGVGTGATLHNVRKVENYATGEFVNNQEVILPEACIGEIYVPKTAQLNYRAQDGQVRSSGSLYEAMVKKQINKVSVGFNPIEGKITENGKITIYNLRSSKLNKEFHRLIKQGLQAEYTLWELLELSVLDINSGQANSKTKRIRSLENNNQPTMSKFKKGDELSRQVKAKINSDPTEKEGKFTYRVMIDDAEESEIDEDELERMFGKTPTKDKNFDEEIVRPNKKRVDDNENSQIRSLEIAVESLQTLVKDLTSKVDQTRSEPEPKTNIETPQPKTNPNPETSAEQKDEELAQRYLDSSVLSSLVAKNPQLLNQIKDGQVKERLTRSLNVKTPTANPSKEPNAQFDGEKVSQLTAQEKRQIQQSKNSIHY